MPTTDASSPPDAPPPPPAAASEPDPHAPKIPPGEARARFPRGPVQRTLRMAPIAIGAAAVAGAVALAIGLALEPATRKPAPKPDRSGATQPPVVPEVIRHAKTGSAIPGPSPRATGAHAARSAPVDFPAASESGPSERARGSGDSEPPRAEAARAGGASILFDVHESDRAASPSPSPATVQTPALGLGAASPAAGDDPNLQQRKGAFLAGGPSGSDTLVATLKHPLSSDALQAGTIIPAVLLTAIDSDLPGPVLAQVRESVYDSVTGNDLVIPQGARLLANYDSMVVWGQERVLVCWNRLIFPNGDSIDLHCMPAADLQGAAGLADGVDEHWKRLIGGAAISSLLAATAQGTAGNQSAYSPTVPQLWASGGAQSVNQTGQQIVRREMVVQPTITVRAGFSVNVVLTKDIALPPYEEQGL